MGKNNVKFTQKQAEQIFKIRGGELLGVYVNARTKVKYKCSCGNIAYTSLDRFKHGKLCKKCGITKYSNSQKHSYEYVCNYFKEHDCELLETEYINAKTKMNYKCNCENISYINFSNFKSGKRCRVCSYTIKRSGENNSAWIHDRNKVRKRFSIHNLSAPYKSKYRKKHNIKDSNFHIDHIYPIKAFIDYEIYDLNLINLEDNLQALSRKENSSKNGKYIKEDFENWLTSKNILFKSQLIKEIINV